MRIGVDFDNTIADYDEAFVAAARGEGLLANGLAGGKTAVRAALRALDGGEERWMRLQGQVYGALMPQARLIEGFLGFLERSRQAGVPVHIVSHKTEFGHFDAARISLRDAARRWMADQGVVGTRGLPPESVVFEGTRREKIARIRSLGCTHFVDDLEEVFRDPDFPPPVARFLLSRGGGALPVGPFRACRSWDEISDAVFA